MKVKIVWTNEETQELLAKVKSSLEWLWLSDFVEVEETNDDGLKTSLNISKFPALVIEEESIDFRDTIFEGIVPPEEELKSMFISIVGWDSGGGCGTGSCSTEDSSGGGCGSWCGCH